METELNVKLLRYTPDPEIAVAAGARLCYSRSSVSDLLEKMTEEKSVELLNKLMDLGHESPMEHASFTFAIEGVSRALTHQLVRHRIASYSQQSQRYVDAKDFNYIIPPSIRQNPEAKQKYEDVMKKLGEIYMELKEISPKEDARFVLPNAAETKIIVTMNARSLKNFFRHRCCARAQWEIRLLAQKMLAECKKVAPSLFKNMGADCITEKVCKEGEMSCGIWKNIPGATLKGFR